MSFGLVCCLVGWLVATAPEGFKEAPGPHGPIFWRGLSSEEVAWTQRELPGAVARVAEQLGWRSQAPFTTVLVPDRGELRRFLERFGAAGAATQNALGVAIPSRRLLVLRWDHVPPSESLLETLTHEVAHLALHESQLAAIPRWLDEGAAQWASGRRLAPQETSYLAFLARIGSLYPLSSMERVFPSRHELSSLAYQQSFLWLEFLAARWGVESVRKLLREVSQGAPVEVVIRGITGWELPRLEREYRAWIQGQASLGAAVASILSLWSLVAVLALVAIARYVWRRRRRMRELEREELTGPGGDEPAATSLLSPPGPP